MSLSSRPLSITRESEDRLVSLLAELLDHVLSANEPADSSLSDDDIPAALVAFYATRVPLISIQDYLDRIFTFSCCSPSCLIVAMVYIERLMAQVLPSVLILTRYNVHRIVVAAILLAAKFLEDIHYDNRYWAKIAGVSVQELNLLELEFLALLNWRLDVSEDTFEHYYFGLLATGTDEPADDLPSLPDVVLTPTDSVEHAKPSCAEDRRRPSRRSYTEEVVKALATYSVPCF